MEEATKRERTRVAKRQEIRKCWIALKDGQCHLVEIDGVTDGSYQLLELQRHHSEPTRTRPWPTRAAAILPAPFCTAAPAYLELLRVASLLCLLATQTHTHVQSHISPARSTIFASASHKCCGHFRLSSCLLSVCTRDTSITPGRGYSSGKVATKTQVRKSLEHAKLVQAHDRFGEYTCMIPEARESDTCLRCLSRAWLSSLVLFWISNVA